MKLARYTKQSFKSKTPMIKWLKRLLAMCDHEWKQIGYSFCWECNKCKKIKIGFNESNLPFYLEDNKFITIVMPIVLEK